MDPYQTLGVSKTATQEEIKKAYRALAKKNHPDLNPGNKGAETKFKDVSHAFDLIGTEEARKKFDRGETQEQFSNAGRSGAGQYYYNTQQNSGRYSDFFGEGLDEDFFQNLFGGSRGRHSHRQSSPDFQGEDQLYQMEVEFRDSILGGEKVITLPNGKSLQVKIPAGIEDGAKLRFKGQGGPGIGNGPPGDAYIEIKVAPHKEFRRVGDDVETEVPISFFEALLGAEIKVPTLDGSVLLKIPSGVSSGSKLRIRDKGVARPGKTGHQIVILKVVMPKEPDPELKQMVKQMNEKFHYDPRAT